MIGVLATVAALAGPRFRRLVEAHAGDRRVLSQPLPGLVERIEDGDLDGPETRAIVAAAVAPLVAGGADQIVLGCTHYPLVAPVIAEAAGPGATLVDSGAAVARQTARVLDAHGLRGGSGAIRFLSLDPEAARPVISRLWGEAGRRRACRRGTRCPQVASGRARDTPRRRRRRVHQRRRGRVHDAGSPPRARPGRARPAAGARRAADRRRRRPARLGRPAAPRGAAGRHHVRRRAGVVRRERLDAPQPGALPGRGRRRRPRRGRTDLAPVRLRRHGAGRLRPGLGGARPRSRQRLRALDPRRSDRRRARREPGRARRHARRAVLAGAALGPRGDRRGRPRARRRPDLRPGLGRALRAAPWICRPPAWRSASTRSP